MGDIIVCSTERASRERFSLSLEGLGEKLFFVESLADLQSRKSQFSPTSILVFDFEFLDTLDNESLKALEIQFSTPFVLISSRTLSMNVAQMKRSERIGHVISQQNENLDTDLKNVLQQILRQAEGLAQTARDVRDIFQVDRTKVTSFQLSDSVQRWECYKELSAYVKTLPAFQGFEDIAATVASELITNAFFNGPRDERDGALYPSRNQHVILTAPTFVEFCYWSDDDHFWLMVVDPFGTLKKSKLISALHRAVTERSVNMENEGGAGLGLTMVAEWASELYFGLLESQSTWIAARLKITKRRKIFFDQRSSLHIYEIKQGNPQKGV